MINNRIKKYLLDTPEKHWLIVRGYHIHKSFWGVFLAVTGIVVCLYSMMFGLIASALGLSLAILDIKGHMATDNKPFFQLWNKHKG